MNNREMVIDYTNELIDSLRQAQRVFQTTFEALRQEIAFTVSKACKQASTPASLWQIDNENLALLEELEQELYDITGDMTLAEFKFREMRP